MQFRTASLILFVGSAALGAFFCLAAVSYNYLYTPHAPSIEDVVANSSSSSQLSASSVCDVPADLEDSIAWLASKASWMVIGTTKCKAATWSSRPPPVMMTFNQSTRMDELRRVKVMMMKPFEENGSASAQPACKYAAVHYDGDNRVLFANEGAEVWKDLPEVLTREQLPARAADGDTRFAFVRCWQQQQKKDKEEDEAKEEANKEIIFENLFIFMPSLEKSVEMRKKREQKRKSAQHQPVSVLILALESTTRANFHRSMPRTAAALKELTGAVFYMKGLTRIGDNTLENMLPFTAGLRITDLPGKKKNKEDEDEDNTVDLNKLTMLWEPFEAAGYATAFIDDNPRISRSMLSYGKGSGFSRPPTTFFPQPFWTVASRGQDEMTDCVFNGTRPTAVELLAQTERFLRYVQQQQQASVPFFVLSMIIRTMHFGWFGAQRADEVYADFLRRLGPTVLAETVLLMVGDHGDRYSSESRMLENGQVEANLPLMAIRLPPALLKRRPQWAEMLLRNRRRLTTNLDVHKTLLAMLREEVEGEEVEDDEAQVTFSANSNSTPPAYSLISEEVPLNRTCDEAGIPELYCVCRMSQRVELPADRPPPELFTGLIANFTSQLNAMLPPERCQRLSVRKVLSMAAFVPIDSPTTPLPPSSSSWMWLWNSLSSLSAPRKEVVEFTLEMAPSGAVLRTRMVRSPLSGWSVVNRAHPIERLNMYGGQSHCLEDRVLRKYCLCWDVKGKEEQEEEEEDGRGGSLKVVA